MIRYPGSKDKITKKILQHFPPWLIDQLFQSERLEYREPFFGGGAVGFDALAMLPSRARVWLNDKDFAMACLWRSVYQDHEKLINLVDSFHPSTDAFYKFKEEDGRLDIDPVIVGFRKFALHQISFSGLGAKAGGPIGGREQSSKYNVDCRWNASRHKSEIMKRHRLLSRFSSVKISSGDFAKLVDGAPPSSFIYLDPPYYEKGGQLYKFNMDDADHVRLASSLRSCAASWVLSYDDHAIIRNLYSWAEIHEINLTYTIAKASETRRKNSEVVIKPRSMSERVA